MNEQNNMSKTIEAPVARVTLLEDRAQVVRMATVPLEQGMNTVSIPAIAPVVSDKTVVIRLGEGANVSVNDVRVSRTLKALEQDKPEEYRKLEKELKALAIEEERVRASVEYGSIKKSRLVEVLESMVEELAIDAAHGRGPDGASEDFTALLDGIFSATGTVRGRQFELEKLRRRFENLHARLESLKEPSVFKGATIEVELISEDSCSIEMTVEYVVPGACWRPRHTARLADGTVHWQTDGCVWQATGEDWKDVELFFSTQRSTLGAEPPYLGDDRLTTQDKPEEEMVVQREQAVQTVGLGAGGAQKKQASQLPGIDDGGETQNISSLSRASIPSDGRPYMVPIGSFESEAEVDLTAVPERAPYAFTRSVVSNKGSFPVLAGPVELIRDSGAVGRTTVLYVAPGEDFELSWGPDPELRISRHASKAVEGPGMLSSWEKRTHTVQLKLSNIGPTKKTLEMRERIPVSEVEKVKVSFDEKGTTGAPEGPDSDGIVRWSIEVPAYGQAKAKLKYVIDKHKSVEGL